MSREQHRRIKRLFLELCDLEPAARLGVLADVDEESRQELETLLEIHDAQGTADLLPGLGEGLVPRTVTPPPPAISEIATGQILADRYEVLELIGRGGMGQVWLAFDLKLRVNVALKALRSDLDGTDGWLDQLRREVRSARQVASPHVCRVFDLVEADRLELVSMEYIDGETLLDVLKNRGPLSLGEASEIAAQFLAGLEAIHRAGLVHRDLKPENIMITASGRAVIMDFGIAKQADSTPGTMAGTPGFMAPEQLRGEPVGPRADVFAAGVVLAELVRPRPESEEESRRSTLEQVQESPPDPPDNPWKHIVRRALAEDPAERYPSAQALARALEEVTLRIEGAEDLEPYPGLAPYTQRNADCFFGREAEVEVLWSRLRELHLLAVIGPSGAGKSSFLRAGLLPTAPSGWSAVFCQPGKSPFAALAQALVSALSAGPTTTEKLRRFDEPDGALSVVSEWRQRHPEVLLIVDQFEELFTLNPPATQGRFAELLARLAVEADVHVLLSMRDDFLFSCHGQPALAPVFSQLTPIGTPTGDALRRALVQPALRCGYRFEDDALVEAMLAEVAGERGALPLLAFAAASLWERRDRDRGVLTRRAFEEIGGVGGALAQHGEATLREIGSDKIPIVQEIFRNLVTAVGTRAVRDRDELLSVFEGAVDGTPGSTGRASTVAEAVLQALIDARLLTSFEVPDVEGEASHARVEIVHESLLSAWPRLVRWTTQDADGARLRDQLRQAAQLWQERGRPVELLWTGASYLEFLAWHERYPGGLSALEEAFAVAMRVHANRRRRRRRWAVAVVVVLLLGVAAGTATLWRRSETARRAAVAEADQRKAAQLLALGRLRLDDYPGAGLAYALASLETADSQAARRFAVESLWRGPPAFVFQQPGHNIDTLAFSPDGDWLVTGGVPATTIWSRSGERRELFSSPDAAPATLEFAQEGRLLVTRVATSGTVRFWSFPEGRPIRDLELEDTQLAWRLRRQLVRGRRLLTFTQEHSAAGERIERVRSWPLEGGEPETLGRWRAADEAQWDVDAEGSWLAYTENGSLYVRRLAELGTSPPRRLGRLAGVAELQFHSSGERIVTSDHSSQLQIWSLDPDAPVPFDTLEGSGDLDRLALDPTGRLVASGSTSLLDVVLLWDLEGPPDAAPLSLRNADAGLRLESLAFDPTGAWLATAHSSFGVLWSLRERQPYVVRDPASNRSLAFTLDGRFLAASTDTGRVRLYPLAPGEDQRVLFADGGNLGMWLQVSRSGDRLLVPSRFQGQVLLIPVKGGPVRALPAFDWVGVPVFDPSEHLVAASTIQPDVAASAEVRVWNLETGGVQVLDPKVTGEDCGPGGASEGRVYSLVFLPDGRLVSLGFSGLRLWDVTERASTLLRPCSTSFFDPTAALFALGGARILVFEEEGQLRERTGERPASDSPPLFIYDVESRTTSPITSHGEQIAAVAVGDRGRLLVTGDRDGLVRVGPISGAEPHLLFGHEGKVLSVAVTPDGRWIASTADDGTIRFWPRPDGAPLHTLPREELLARLRATTNLRVAADDRAASGYHLEVGPFPGWEVTPAW